MAFNRNAHEPGKKILVTLGPSSLKPETIREMAGFSPYVFRLNMSHLGLDQLPACIKMIQSTTDVPVCIDSEGAQIRTYQMAEGLIRLEEGRPVELLSDLAAGRAGAFSLTPVGIAASLEAGDLVRLDWHGAAIRVISSQADKAVGVVVKGGPVGSCKAVDVSRPIALPAITEKDRAAVAIAREHGVGHYALSFANTVADVQAFRSLAGPEARIISKLESIGALENLGAILAETDEALIDRGDLSRAVPLEKVPFFQIRMISMARALGTPIYVATNLLESMVENGLPTRAELNDITSTILMGADGLVLAAESAIGKYPARCVALAARMIQLCEKWTINSTIDDIWTM